MIRAASTLCIAFLIAAGAAASDKTETFRGTYTRAKSRSIYLQIDGKTRDVVISRDTVLVDANGVTIATGPKPIIAALRSGTNVVVTWKPFWVPDGSGVVTGYYRAALEVRIL